MSSSDKNPNNEDDQIQNLFSHLFGSIMGGPFIMRMSFPNKQPQNTVKEKSGKEIEEIKNKIKHEIEINPDYKKQEEITDNINNINSVLNEALEYNFKSETSFAKLFNIHNVDTLKAELQNNPEFRKKLLQYQNSLLMNIKNVSSILEYGYDKNK